MIGSTSLDARGAQGKKSRSSRPKFLIPNPASSAKQAPPSCPDLGVRSRLQKRTQTAVEILFSDSRDLHSGCLAT